MPVANKSEPKSGYKKKVKGPGTDAEAAIAREDKPVSKDGTKRGRLPGSKTKSVQLLEDAQAIIAQKHGIENWHPVIHMMLVASDPEGDPTMRLNAAAKAAPYVAGTLKSVELTGEDGGPIEVDMTGALLDLARRAGKLNDDGTPKTS